MPRGKYGAQYSQEQLEEAVRLIKEGRISQKKASKKFSIPVMTLSNHVNGRVKEGVKAGGQTVMPADMEAAFAKRLMELADLGFGLTRSLVMVKARELCIEAKLKHPFGETKAGRSWYAGFMKRNPCLSQQKPAQLSTMRGKARDRDKIRDSSRDLQNLLMTNGGGPDTVLNMDESGFNMEHTPVKIVCREDKTKMTRNIYFAGSIRGGRQDVDIYYNIIEQLKTYGHVLTEFVGDKNLNDGTNGSSNDKNIHDTDVAMLQKCNAVVAEVTQPSLGVGYELGRAVAMHKQILCLFRPTGGKILSGMIRGAHNGSTFIVVDYEDVSEVPDILKKFFDDNK